MSLGITVYALKWDFVSLIIMKLDYQENNDKPSPASKAAKTIILRETVNNIVINGKKLPKMSLIEAIKIINSLPDDITNIEFGDRLGFFLSHHINKLNQP